MKLWLIFVQTRDRLPATWLEAAWDDESTAENPDGWTKEVERVEKLAHDSGYEMRVCETEIAGVYELFDAPRLRATDAKAAE